MKHDVSIVRRSLTSNQSDAVHQQEADNGFRKYVKFIVAESRGTYCLSSGKVCVAGPRGPKGTPGNRGKRGPKGTRGKTGTKGFMGPPGKSGKQGMKGDVGNPGMKGEKGDKGVAGHPGPEGEPGQSLCAPNVNVSPASHTENQTATFHCSASGHPKPKVSWRKVNGAELVTTDGPDNQLHIRNAGYNDSGSYMCTATSVLGKVQKMVKLFVEVSPQFIEIPKGVIKVIGSTTAAVSCKAFGFPSPTIVWSRGFVKLPGRSTVINGTLTIASFSPQDAGPYQCKASNKLGSTSAVTTLTYNRGLWWRSSILRENEFYQRHLNQFLTPAVGSHPHWQLCYRASTHGWAADTFHSRCDGKRNTVIIVKAGEYVFGGYTDIPWESSGRYTSTPNAFLFSLQNKEGLAPFKSMVRRPSYAISRQSGDGPIFGTGNDIYIANNANSNRHSQANFGYNNVYSVPSGVQNKQTLLAGDKGVPGLPGPRGEPGQSIAAPNINVSSTSLTITENQTATFYCSAYGNPKPTVTWRRMSSAGQVNMNSPDTRLQTKNAKYNDSGSYVCMATSVLGKVQKAVKFTFEDGGTNQCKASNKLGSATVLTTLHYVPTDSSGGWTSTSEAFIFSQRNKEGLAPFKSLVTSPTYAIFRQSGFGPTFGSGYDICIQNNANRNTNSYTYFGHSYSVPIGVKDRRTILAGTYNFTPDDVDVFYLR
ncbi:Basement membrane-specific heparan sulfate proteoglycan core protein [Stylophora pistillata]|uniref:Basement membrane-specific heparan sulfate proteoglycan core protein n=1 Tax=Stylophora pistillata TaxID=50429 RepID=A0A2B4RIA0_STYPI|nr:Basement membrane-specific heparan sulfate proteoglycan core protein [Stylophora pistillata]